MKYVTQGFVERAIAVITVQDQVERGGRRTVTPACPFRWGLAPETPNLWGAQSDLEPMVANEQEIARPFLQFVEVALERDVPTEDVAKDFGRECGDIQQRVPSAFELD